MSKIRLGLLFGGKSPEHEVSVVSAKNILQAIDKDKYEIILLGITLTGKWVLLEKSFFDTNPTVVEIGKALAVIPGNIENRFLEIESATYFNLDVIFPITHGPNGEDGTLQGLLKQIDIPFVGPGVLASAVSMDKDFTKRILRDAGINVAKGLVFNSYEKATIQYNEVVGELGEILFIKPCNMGSSVGVAKATDEVSFNKAIENAFVFDTKILIETGLVGREIETAVLGNENPEASCLGEIIMEKGFYDFESKYVSGDAAKLYIPAQNITETQEKKIQETAIKAYKALGLEGLTRVDVFLCDNDEVYINEPNTLPGFTSVSMYPKLWENSGLAYANLIDKLIDLAIQRNNRDLQIKRSRV